MRGLMVAVVALATLAALADPAAPIVPPPPATFVEFLAGLDLVVEGTVLAAHEVKRPYAETCGTTGLMVLPITEVTLRVDRILAGICPDTIVAISALDHGYFPDGHPEGRRVIAWANRSCDDAWRLRGHLGVMQPDGAVVGARGGPVSHQLDGSVETVTVASLAAQRGKFSSQPAGLFEGAAAIGLARRTDRNGWTPDGATFQLDSLGWLIGHGARLPRAMRFPFLAGCRPDIMPGDSLLVPVPAAFVGDTLIIDRCPSALRVQQGFAPGLGVEVRARELGRALARTGSTLHVRPVLERGQ